MDSLLALADGYHHLWLSLALLQAPSKLSMGDQNACLACHERSVGSHFPASKGTDWRKPVLRSSASQAKCADSNFPYVVATCLPSAIRGLRSVICSVGDCFSARDRLESLSYSQACLKQNVRAISRESSLLSAICRPRSAVYSQGLPRRLWRLRNDIFPGNGLSVPSGKMMAAPS